MFTNLWSFGIVCRLHIYIQQGVQIYSLRLQLNAWPLFFHIQYWGVKNYTIFCNFKIRIFLLLSFCDAFSTAAYTPYAPYPKINHLRRKFPYSYCTMKIALMDPQTYQVEGSNYYVAVKSVKITIIYIYIYIYMCVCVCVCMCVCVCVCVCVFTSCMLCFTDVSYMLMRYGTHRCRSQNLVSPTDSFFLRL